MAVILRNVLPCFFVALTSKNTMPPKDVSLSLKNFPDSLRAQRFQTFIAGVFQSILPKPNPSKYKASKSNDLKYQIDNPLNIRLKIAGGQAVNVFQNYTLYIYKTYRPAWKKKMSLMFIVVLSEPKKVICREEMLASFSFIFYAPTN